jgi:deferrochelatase/peroxidase EfeB
MNDTPDEHTGRRISRRNLLRVAGMAGAALALDRPRQVAAQMKAPDERAGGANGSTIPFYGRYQAGIATPPQKHLHFAAFDLTIAERDQLQELLHTWSAAAARMCAGLSVDETAAHPQVPPLDTGETAGHLPARLTITFGFGPTLFERDGVDRFGLRAHRPAALVDIPPMPGDELNPAQCGGDLCVQACADDPQVAFHAVRNLARLAAGLATMRWSQLGFAPAVGSGTAQRTPRNLLGFKDGTNNIAVAEASTMDAQVWVDGAEGPGWMTGGTYLVARRIRMAIESWDNTSLDHQEKVFGRHKLSGAPLGGEDEHQPLPLESRTDDGQPRIPDTAHVRLAHGDGSQRILRRGYSFTDGIDAQNGQLNAGLFFIAFQRDPQRQFVPILQRLAASDALNEYTTHTGSAIFACPPGAAEGRSIGQELFEIG